MKLQFDLKEQQNKIVKHYMAEYDFDSKGDAINDMILKLRDLQEKDG